MQSRAGKTYKNAHCRNRNPIRRSEWVAQALQAARVATREGGTRAGVASRLRSVNIGLD